MIQQTQLAIPAFRKGKHQLDTVDVEKNQGIANVCIDVKKGYWSPLPEVLDIVWNSCQMTVIPNSNGSQEEATTPMIDRITHLSAALVNLCTGIVALD